MVRYYGWYLSADRQVQTGQEAGDRQAWELPISIKKMLKKCSLLDKI
jgi:hypothetical protein